mgnify:FL=1
MAKPYPKEDHLIGNFAPLRMESNIGDLIVEGDIPIEINGTYYRNGPDPKFPPRGGKSHWFGGDGMVHAFHINDGKMSYINRWMRTVKWNKEDEAGEALFPSGMDPTDTDPSVKGLETDGLANTAIVSHAGKLLALEEAHAPFEFDPHTLESIGSHTFEGKLQGPVTAHPKVDPKTGELLFFGYMADGFFSDTIRFTAVSKDGKITKSEIIKAPFPSMVHDFYATENYIIIPVFPLTGDFERVINGGPAFAWEPEKGTHICILPRNGSAEDAVWIESDPSFVFHYMNAYEENGSIISDCMEFGLPPLFPYADGTMPKQSGVEAKHARWEIDLNKLKLSKTSLDTITGEFPRFDERFALQKYSNGYYAGNIGKHPKGMSLNSIIHYDYSTSERHSYTTAEGGAVGEPVFAPKSKNSPDGEGWLIATEYSANENRSNLIILDAQNVSDGPVATAQLPHRIPYGFHGWYENRS